MDSLTGLLNRVDRDTENHRVPHPAADLPRHHIFLAHMDSVRPACDGNIHVVIHNKGYVVPAAQGADVLSLLKKRRFVQLFLPQLHTSYAAFQCRFYLLIESLLPAPGPVGDSIEQHMPLIAFHSLLLSPVPPGSGGTWRR